MIPLIIFAGILAMAVFALLRIAHSHPVKRMPDHLNLEDLKD